MLNPGNQYGDQRRAKLDFISLSLALVLGTAGLPHVLMRFYTVPTAQGGAPLGGLGDLADRHLLPVHAGPRLRRRCAGRAGDDRRRTGRANSAAPLLAFELGGTILLGHHRGGRVRDDPRGRRRTDHHRGGVVRARHLRQRHRTARPSWTSAEVRVARLTAVVIGIVSIVGGILANGPEHRVPGGAGVRGRGHRPTCRRSSTRCSGSGSTPAARCGACTAG